MTRLLPFILFILPGCIYAQFTYVLVGDSIPVLGDKGTVLSTPWTGGLNAAQYNTMDLNEDGKDDLVLFDRMADKIITFLNVENQYQYAPEYESFFPEEITNWLLLRDFNCDGKKDIFTGDILGIKVFTNVTPDNHGGNFEWKQFLFYTGFTGAKSEVLLTKGFSGKINLQLHYDDLPAIIDADGDGDLDIFNIQYSGNGTVEFHRNNSKSCDSLDFERVTQKWGGFTECTCDDFAFNDEKCSEGGRTKHAGGKSLLALDVNGDTRLDMLLSEAECTNLSLLKNEGDLLNPVITSASDFPAATPADFLIYPAAYYEDVDFDGKKDLIATPNIFAKSFLNINLWQSNWLYRNTGTNSNPVFVLAKRNFLQESMLDVGDNAVPAFTDFDADGDYDMFISNNNFPAGISVYKNTGTLDKPSFEFLTENYLGLSALSFYNLKIQFADINSDNKTDLVFTATDYQDNFTRLYYLPNQNSTGLDFSGQSLQLVTFTVVSTENILVADIDNDGKADILLGKSNGALEYWKGDNTGSPSFTREDESYLGITPSVLRQNLSAAIADLNADGKGDLVLGDQTGHLRIINNFRKATTQSEAIDKIVFNSLAPAYESPNLGGRLWPTVVNLFNANKPSIVVGTTLGGVRVLKNDEGKSLPGKPVISIYPNPVAKTGVLNVAIDRPAFMQLYSATGQEISTPYLLHANEVLPIRLPYLAPGIYIARFIVNNKSFAQRFVIY